MFMVVVLPQPDGPEQRDERAVVRDEVEVLDGLHLAEVLRQALEPDLRHAAAYRLIAPKVRPRTR